MALCSWISVCCSAGPNESKAPIGLVRLVTAWHAFASATSSLYHHLATEHWNHLNQYEGPKGFFWSLSLSAASLLTLPNHLTGTIIEKIYVPSALNVSRTNYSGVRGGQYSIVVVKEEQWIAVVRLDKGDTLVVHCNPDHYGMKNVGERIHFREYEGSILHIRYFAHGEEEGSVKSK